MSTAILPIYSSSNVPAARAPILPTRRVANVDSLHEVENHVPIVVVFCSPADADPDSIVAELRQRGCVVTRTNLAESGYESDTKALTTLSEALRSVSRCGATATAVSITVPHRGLGLEPQYLEFDGLVIDRRRHTVCVNHRLIDFSKTELDLLYLLASYPGIVLSRRELVEACKGEAYPATDRSIDVQIVGIRRKLGPFRHYLQTVRGVGYRFEPTAQKVDRRGTFPK